MFDQPISGNANSYGDLDGNYNAIGEGAKVLVKNINQAFSRIDELEREAQIAERILAERIKAVASSHQLAIHEARHATRSANPYKALLNYRLRDAPYFFGREVPTYHLYNRLKENPLTILHSASGSGKTSLIKAGLSSQLLQEGHLPLYLRPFKQNPQISIKRAFLPDFDRLKELERFKEMSLKGFLERVVTYLGDQQLYIFIDQFEEFFTMQNSHDRQEFALELKECVDSTLPVHWMLALRKEYFSDLQIFKSLNPFGNEYFLDTFQLAEAKEVILKPALMHYVTYEEGLIAQIIDDLKQENRVSPSHIQLVCHTLFEELKESQNGSEIKRSLYMKKRGQPGKEGQPGSKGILASHLTRVLNRDLDREERKVASRLFEELVSSNSQRVVVEEDVLKTKLDDFDSGVIQNVLEKLEMSRLIRKELDDAQYPVYELAHDYLLTEIQLDSRTLQRKAAQELLTSEVRAYTQHRTLLSEEKYNIISSQQGFLKIDAVGAELLRKSKQQIDEIENAELRQIQRLAEEQTKRAEEAEARQLAEAQRAESEAERARESMFANRQLQRLALVLAGMAIIAVGMAGWAFWARNQAAESQRAAERNEAVAKVETLRAEEAENVAEVKAAEAIKAEEMARISEENAKESEAAAIEAQMNALAAQASAEEANERAQTPALLALSEEILPEGVNPSKDEFDTAMLMAIHAFNKNKSFTEDPPVTLASINEQFRELALFNAQRPVWTSDKWGGEELASTSHISFSADGEWAVSTKVQPGFYLWRDNDAESPYTFDLENSEKNSFVTHLNISNDGTHFVTINNLKEIDVWKISKSEDQIPLSIVKIASPQIPEEFDFSNLFSPIFSPDGDLVLVGSNIGRVFYWDMDALDKEAASLRGHRGKEITTLAFSPEGEFLATGGRENIYLWDLRKRSSINRLRIDFINGFGAGDYASALQFSPKKNILAAGGQDGNVQLWNISNPSAPTRLPSTFLGDPGSLASSIKFSDDETKIAVGQANGSIYIWSTLTPETPRILDGNNLTAPNSFAFSDDDNALLSVDSQDSKLRVWDLGLPEFKRSKIRGDDFGLDSMAYVGNQSNLVTFGVDKNLKILDLESLHLSILEVKTSRDGLVSKTTFSTNGDFFARYINNFSNDRFEIFRLTDNTPQIVAGTNPLSTSLTESNNKELSSVNLQNPTPVHTIEFEPASKVEEMVISPDGSQLVVGYGDKPYFHMWNLTDPDLQEPVEIKSSDLISGTQAFGPFIFSRNGDRLAFGANDSEKSGILIFTFDAETNQIKSRDFYPFEKNEDWVASPISLAFSSDSRYLAVSDNTPKVQMIDFDSSEPSWINLNNGNVEVNSLAFSAPIQNPVLVFGDVRGSLRVLPISANPEIEDYYYLEGHRNKVNSIQFSPDGSHISSISDDGFILVQPLLDTLIESACIRAKRDDASLKALEEHLPNVEYDIICGEYVGS